MTPRRLAIAGLVAALTLGAGPVAAHPNYAMYDLQQDIILKGTVMGFEYTIPHSWLHFVAIAEDGTEQRYALEMEPAHFLMGQGIRRDFFEAGDTLTLKMHPMRDGRPAGLLAASISLDGSIFGDADGLEAPTEVAVLTQ